MLLATLVQQSTVNFEIIIAGIMDFGWTILDNDCWISELNKNLRCTMLGSCRARGLLEGVIFLTREKNLLFAHFLKFCKLKKSCGTTLLKTLLQIQGRILNSLTCNIEKKMPKTARFWTYNAVCTKWPQNTKINSRHWKF